MRRGGIASSVFSGAASCMSPFIMRNRVRWLHPPSGDHAPSEKKSTKPTVAARSLADGDWASVNYVPPPHQRVANAIASSS
jgi:hypothetical protein